jgi:CRISPR/Cas system CMR-associated protein Cmr5 small subunit
MAFKSVEDLLKDPKHLNARHNINFGSSFLKLESLIVAKGLNITLNSLLVRGVQLAIKEFKRNNKPEYDALMKKYGGVMGKDKG